jgi:S1-C subfamily serine protease
MSSKFLSLALLALPVVATAAESPGEAAFRSAIGWTAQVRGSVSRPFIEDEQGSWLGAGLVVDSRRGWVLTNAHVAGHSYGTVAVAFRDNHALVATRVYVDPHLDLAILAFDPAQREGTAGEPVLDCDSMPPAGHPVGAFGHPWGFRYTATRGITSAITTRLGPTMLQTDAPINEGNSGGPLISLETGKVVGVNAAKIKEQSVEGLSFAVPMPYACTIIDLMKKGIDPSPPAPLVDFARDANDEQTLVVARSRLPAGTLDLRVGDEILAIARPQREIETESDLADALRGRLDQVSLVVDRDGRQVTVEGSWPPAQRILERKGLWVSGALFAEADPTTAGLVTGSPALMVHHVSPGSVSELATLTHYDLLVSADGQPVASLGELEQLARAAATAHRPLRLMLLRLTGETETRLFGYAMLELPVSEVEIVGPVT